MYGLLSCYNLPVPLVFAGAQGQKHNQDQAQCQDQDQNNDKDQNKDKDKDKEKDNCAVLSSETRKVRWWPQQACPWANALQCPVLHYTALNCTKIQTKYKISKKKIK